MRGLFAIDRAAESDATAIRLARRLTFADPGDEWIVYELSGL